MASQRIPDVAVVGGGVIGLSIAWRLAEEGVAVTVLERGEPGREASWAGAGMLYGGDPAAATSPYAKLMALSSRLHAEWHVRLLEATGIDNGWRRCGGLAVALDADEEPRLRESEPTWCADGIRFRTPSADELRELEPALAADVAAVRHFPDTAQVRNPRHLKALTAVCAARGVKVQPGTPALGLLRDGNRVTGVRTPAGPQPADAVVVAAGPWSEALLAEAGLTVKTKPIRGQIVLLSTPTPLVRSVIEVGHRYLVPRDDGRLLVGSTEEDAGFQKRNTPEGIAGLLGFAAGLVPATADATFEQAWSGLRPGNADGRPYIGACASLPGLYVAAGHFRHGLQLSTGTAAVVADLILGRAPAVALGDFRPERHS